MHGEVTDSDVDFFDREAVFIERHLKPLLDEVPVSKAEHVNTWRLLGTASHAVANHVDSRRQPQGGAAACHAFM